MGNGLTTQQHMNFVNHRRKSYNAKFVNFLARGWPGSILKWTDEDLETFAGCFRPIHVPADKEIFTNISDIEAGGARKDGSVVVDPNVFFIVAEGAVEVHAILPTKNKKTDNIREFLCKKDRGDMVYIPSVRKLITESNAKEIYERENKEHKEHTSHKNALDLIDMVSIKSLGDATILQLDWPIFHAKFGSAVDRPPDSELDVGMLLTIMQTNLTDYLSNIPILDGIPHTKLEVLSRLCHYCVKKEGDVVCREGDVGDEVFMVLSGEVRVDATATERMVEVMRDFDAAAIGASGRRRTLGSSRSASSRNVLSSSCSASEGDEGHSSKSSLSLSGREEYCRKGSVTTGCDYASGVMRGGSAAGKGATASRASEVEAMMDLPPGGFKSKKELSDGQRNLRNRQTMLFQAGRDLRRELVQRKLDREDKGEEGQGSTKEESSGTGNTSTASVTPSLTATAASATATTGEGDERNRHVELAHLGAGDYFGEMATFVELPRAATVTATSNVLLAALSKTNFRTLYHAISPELERTVEDEVKKHMLQNIFSLKSPFLERISIVDSDRMAGKTSIVKFEKGDTVFREGEEADRFYFVYSGTLSVEKSSGTDANGTNARSEGQPSITTARRKIGSLYPGDYFGEMALLNKAKRLATISATSNAVLLEITRDDFNETFRSTPWLVAEFIVRMKGRNVDLEALVDYETSRDVFAAFLTSSGTGGDSGKDDGGGDGGNVGAVTDLEFFEDAIKFERDWREAGMTLGSWKSAKDLVDKYLVHVPPSASGNKPPSLDLPDEVSNPLIETVRFDSDGEVGGDMFAQAKAVVSSRLEDHFTRFKSSKEFRKLMKRMRAYDDLDNHLLA